jgi:hypothetical protein
VIKRTRVLDRYGREVEDEDENGRIIVPDGGVCHVEMQFLDGRGAVLRDLSREAYERMCTRLSNAHRAGKPRSKPLSDADFSGTSRVAWAKARIARQQAAHKHP